VRTSSTLDARLEEVLERLEAFREARGHLYVPSNHLCEDGFRLGLWVVCRRGEARRGELHPRYEVLSSLPGWDWESCDPRLIKGLEWLRVYVEEYGTSRAPLWYICEDGFRLGVWVRSRRQRPSKCLWLNATLEAMPGWRVSRSGVPPRWRSDRVIDEELLRRLERFRAEYGSLPVERRYRCDDGFRLGEWLRRCLARGPERHEMLRRALASGPWPITTSETRRRDALAHMWRYVQEKGTACVPASHECDDCFRLGAWVARRRRRRGVDPALDAQLESLPGWTWEPIEEGFRRRVRLAQEALQAGRLGSDVRLRDWVREQERRARSGVLRPAWGELLKHAGLIDVAPASRSGRNNVHQGSPAATTCSANGDRPDHMHSILDSGGGRDE